MTASKRITFEFGGDAVTRLDDLKLTTNAVTYAEVVRNSLRVYEWFVQQEKAGYGFGLIKDGSLIKEIQIFL